MKKIFFLLIFWGIAVVSHAQTLVGKITDTENNAVLIANATLREASSPTVIQEFVQARGGQYRLVAQKTYQRLLIEVASFGYVSDTLLIDSPKKDSTYTLNFVLKLAELDLKEVVVTAKKSPFEQKEDTVSFNVSAYRDGSERKIQDIIKKLPGVDVDEKTGIIKYKGKPVEAVTLEGDDLFGDNYTLGTRNINVDMVEQVQAIDNYSANPLLKGIEAGDKVSLNLKLKKGKMDFSGEIVVGAGVADGGKAVTNSSANLLGISKNYKSYSTGSYNNVGVNNTPFDYFSNSLGAEKVKDKDYFAQKAIAESSFSSILGDNRANINSAWFGNHNAMFKVKKRLSVKFNLFYVQDNIFSLQTTQNINTINNQIFTTTDERTTQKKPVQYRGDVELKCNTSKTSLLEYKSIIRQENIETPVEVLMNESNRFASRLSSKDFYWKQNALFTQKLGKKKVLQVSAIHAQNKAPQILTFNPSVLAYTQYEQDTQNSEFRKTYSEGKIAFLGANKIGKYSVSVGGILNETPYISSLFSSSWNNVTSSKIENNLMYNQSKFYQTSSYTIEKRNWKITPAYTASKLNQKWQAQDSSKMRDMFLLEPSLGIKYTLNSVSNLTARASYTQSPILENYLYQNGVMVSNRLTITNDADMRLQKRTSYLLAYFNNNLDKLFKMSISANYKQMQGNYFSNFFIQENTSTLHNFFLPEGTDNMSANFMINQFFLPIDTDITFRTNYSISNYKNILNGSELRHNQATNWSGEISFNTAFDIPINFRETFSFSQNEARSQQGGAFVNQSLYNMFKILIKPSSSWFISLNSEYYLPNMQKKRESYLFLDLVAQYQKSGKPYSFSLSANNLLNNNVFRQVQTSDYALSIYQSNLLPRYILLGFHREF